MAKPWREAQDSEISLNFLLSFLINLLHAHRALWRMRIWSCFPPCFQTRSKKNSSLAGEHFRHRAIKSQAFYGIQHVGQWTLVKIWCEGICTRAHNLWQSRGWTQRSWCLSHKCARALSAPIQSRLALAGFLEKTQRVALHHPHSRQLHLNSCIFMVRGSFQILWVVHLERKPWPDFWTEHTGWNILWGAIFTVGFAAFKGTGWKSEHWSASRSNIATGTCSPRQK